MLFTEIIKDNKIFLRCFRSGKFVSCGFLTVYFIPNKLPVSRFGISVGKKQGGAVQRNRIKRIFRAGYRLCEKELPIGYDLVFAARNDACEKSSDDVVKFIRRRVIPAINVQENGKSKKNTKK
ncbi:ribonuclease P protein component [Ruminococcaceae bacterium FB2012]|nr:ribonuclease P protein component [Ruminococcaceae bacterium FB2012]